MKYIDRSGNVTIEDNSQDRFLRHLYNDLGGRLCLKVLVRPFVSKLGGWFLSSPLSKGLIAPFVRKNGIDLSEYEERQYNSYNDFFCRKIRPGRRPADPSWDVLVSPCDGKLTVSKIEEDSRFLIKNTEYTVESLLRNKKLAERYKGGYAFIIRLTVDNYHHYIYPAGGLKSPQKKLSGVLHTVNPAANDVFPIYTENAREYCLIKTSRFGTLLQMEVGALMVGRICNLHPGTTPVLRGNEKGMFAFGGSTVILLVQKGRVKIDPDLLRNTEEGYETILKMGERIGEA